MGKKREEKEKRKKNGRRPCCEREGVRKGAWTAEEDKILVDFITQNGHGTWRNLPKLAGLLRCGKSCRLRWTNYLRPDIKRGPFSPQEENTIIHLHAVLGNKWAAIASHLAGRTDNDVKNFWNSHLRKRAVTQPCSSLDMKDEPLNAPSASKSKGDYFLRLWNSGVGESFRSINESTNENSQTSSLTKVETDDQKVQVLKDPGDLAAYSDSSKSYEIDDSSDSMLKLLLDFPVGGNDMGFLEAPHDDIFTYVRD